MMKYATTALLIALAGTVSATAQTSTTPAPATRPATAMPAPSAASTPGSDLILNDEQAKNWINKVVYSNDGKNLGEVAAFARDGSGHVTEMHADVGGFLGLGETRVRLMPAQFSMVGDKVILSMTAEQAKSLPRIEKK